MPKLGALPFAAWCLQGLRTSSAPRWGGGQKQLWQLLCCHALDFKCHHFHTAGSPSRRCSRNATRHVTCSLSPLLGLGESPTSL